MRFHKLFTLITEEITRGSQSEIEYFFEEVFEDSAWGLMFMPTGKPPAPAPTHPKFDKLIFGFHHQDHNGTRTIKVFTGAGSGSAESDNGSITVTAFDITNGSVRLGTNAVNNSDGRNNIYDPVIRNGRDLLLFVKSLLNRGGDGDRPTTPTPQKTPGKKIESLQTA